MRFTMTVAAALLAGFSPAAAVESLLACPPLATQKAAASLPAGWWRGERTEEAGAVSPADRSRLSQIWIVAGRRGDERAPAPAILKPENPDGSWDLAAERDGLLVVCLYGGSRVYFATALEPGTVACRAETRHDRQRNILVGNRVRCR